MPPGEIRIRPARPDEAAALTAVVLRSKAAWGYDGEMMAAFRAELAVTPARIAAFGIRVAEAEGRPLGLYGLTVEGDAAEIELFFVEPARMRRGIGRRLWADLMAAAADRGARRILIAADPDAEGFYGAMGARRIGTVASGSIPGRRLPRLEYRLS